MEKYLPLESSVNHFDRFRIDHIFGSAFRLSFQQIKRHNSTIHNLLVLGDMMNTER